MREAGALARKTAQSAFRHWTKGEDRSPVTEADIAVNDLLHEQLTALCPGAGWLSEETAEIPVVDNTYVDCRSDRRHARFHLRTGRLVHFGGARGRRTPACCRALRAGERRDFSRGARDRCDAQRYANQSERQAMDCAEQRSPDPSATWTGFQVSRRARSPSRKSTRSLCGSRAWRKGPSTLLSRRGAATTGTLQPPTFWCTKPAAR